jgi:hypothetical protein
VKFRIARLIGVLFASVLVITPAMATHEVDHRFVIMGEVRFEDGSRAAGETIELTVKDGVPMGTTKTNDLGRYRIMLHVHDEDVNKVFDLIVRDVKKKVRIEFDPEDHKTERGKRVDFTIKP